MSETHKAVARRFIHAFATHDRSVLEELLAPEFVIRVPERPEPIDRDGYLHFLDGFAATFGEIEFTIEDQLAEADRVATRYTWRATHVGPYGTVAPTGKRISNAGLDIARIADGRIVERWTISDQLGLLQQLGLAPSM